MVAKISPTEFYNQLASTYDATLKDPRIDAQHLKEAAKIFQKYNSQAGGSLLDLGCGTGLLRELLKGEFKYTGIDLAEKMLHYASERGYKIIHQPIEAALPQIPDCSYDFVFALGCLLFIEDIHSTLAHINRIARKSILLSLDNLTQEFVDNATVTVYDHSQVSISNAKEDYTIRGWRSPTTGITIQTRMIYLEKVNPS